MSEDIISVEKTLSVARMNLRYRTNFLPVSLIFPQSYEKFLTKTTAEASKASAVLNEFNLTVEDRTEPDRVKKTTSICITDIWELWNNSKGQFTFIGPLNKPHVTFHIDHEFSNGVVYGDFSGKKAPETYAFEGIEIVIFANWLANFSDVILHAAGIAVDGKGYAFVGSSGVGKSTLAEALAKEPGVTMLGEDQVVLRYLEEQFWIFGTPWHERPELCSPIGVPLTKVFFLERTDGEQLERLLPVEGVKRLLQTAFIPYYRSEKMPGILGRLTMLAEEVPFYRIRYQIGSTILPEILAPQSINK